MLWTNFNMPEHALGVTSSAAKSLAFAVQGTIYLWSEQGITVKDANVPNNDKNPTLSPAEKMAKSLFTPLCIKA